MILHSMSNPTSKFVGTNWFYWISSSLWTNGETNTCSKFTTANLFIFQRPETAGIQISTVWLINRNTCIWFKAGEVHAAFLLIYRAPIDSPCHAILHSALWINSVVSHSKLSNVVTVRLALQFFSFKYFDNSNAPNI